MNTDDINIPTALITHVAFSQVSERMRMKGSRRASLELWIKSKRKEQRR